VCAIIRQHTPDPCSKILGEDGVSSSPDEEQEEVVGYLVECFHGLVGLIAVAIDEVVVIRHSLWTGRDGAKEGEAPLVRWVLAFGVVEVCAALATHIGFVSQRPVIVDHVGIPDIMLEAGAWLLGCRGAGWFAH
jgi:hypothetical protein